MYLIIPVLHMPKETTTIQIKRVPTLRFPWFSDSWEEKRLWKIAEFLKWKWIAKIDVVEDWNLECIRYWELYTKYWETINSVYSKTNLNPKNLILSKANDVIIPASWETQIDIAKASCVLNSSIALWWDLNIIRSKNNWVFLSYYLNSKKKFDIARLSQWISVVHLYSSQLKTLKLNLPSLPEQEKIASFLTTVDEKIEKIREKKKSMEEYKKGLMQKIFSVPLSSSSEAKDLKEGKDYFRFPGFSEKWEEKKLGDVCEITTWKLDANAMVENWEYRFYTCAKDYFKIDDYAFDTEALLVSWNGANVWYIHYYKGKFNAYQRTYVLDKFDGNIFYIKYFLEKFLKNRIWIEKKDWNTPYIVLGTLADMKILFPSLSEQEKIADFLSAIDEKIEKIDSELDWVVEWKKGLLHGLFV